MRYKNTILTWATLLGLTLLTGCQNGGGDTNSEEKVLQKGWYVKVTVESSTLKDRGIVLGYLQGSSDGRDKYDSEALSGGGRDHLYATLYHADYGDTQHYKSDYRAYKETGEGSGIWTIVVNSSDENADITLSWNGITQVTKTARGGFKEEQQTQSPELEKMRLIDTVNGEVVPATQEGMRITFNMNGATERMLQWVLLKEGDPEPTAQALPVVAHTQNVQKQKADQSDRESAIPTFEKR